MREFLIVFSKFQCLFDFRYVRLPFSICNVIDGTARYDIVKTAISKLLQPLKTYKQIEVPITNLFSPSISLDSSDRQTLIFLNRNVSEAIHVPEVSMHSNNFSKQF